MEFIYIMKIEKRWCKLKEITLGSLFDGIGVFPLAERNVGIKTLWASEIDKNAIAISKRHFPDVEHLGDITKHKNYKLLSDYNEKNAFDIEKYLKRKDKVNLKENMKITVVDMDV